MQGILVNDNGTNVFQPKKREKVDFAMYVIENKDKSLLLSKIGKHYADLFVFNVLESQLSVITGVADVKQIEIAKLAGIHTVKICASMKRLKDADLIRKFDKCDGVPSGFVLHPDVVVIGDHKRARALWKKAGEQNISKKNASFVVQTAKIIKALYAATKECDDYEDAEKIIEKAIIETDDEMLRNEINLCFNTDKYGEECNIYIDKYLSIP